jgi:hypothetical protein
MLSNYKHIRILVSLLKQYNERSLYRRFKCDIHRCDDTRQRHNEYNTTYDKRQICFD